jgi:hypothetical protein
MSGKTNGRDPEAAEPYSAPCQMHEADPAYFGYMTTAETIDLLNLLLEGERAGVRAATALREAAEAVGCTPLVRQVGDGEARCCAMLDRHIQRLGGTPSHAVGRFYDKFVAIEGLAERLTFLNRGQEWVIRKLREELPRIADERLHADLDEMLRLHVTNVAACEDALVGMKRGA